MPSAENLHEFNRVYISAKNRVRASLDLIPKLWDLMCRQTSERCLQGNNQPRKLEMQIQALQAAGSWGLCQPELSLERSQMEIQTKSYLHQTNISRPSLPSTHI